MTTEFELADLSRDDPTVTTRLLGVRQISIEIAEGSIGEGRPLRSNAVAGDEAIAGLLNHLCVVLSEAAAWDFDSPRTSRRQAYTLDRLRASAS